MKGNFEKRRESSMHLWEASTKRVNQIKCTRRKMAHLCRWRGKHVPSLCSSWASWHSSFGARTRISIDSQSTPVTVTHNQAVAQLCCEPGPNKWYNARATKRQYSVTCQGSVGVKGNATVRQLCEERHLNQCAPTHHRASTSAINYASTKNGNLDLHIYRLR